MGAEPSFVSLKYLAFKGMSKWKEWLCFGRPRWRIPSSQEALYRELSHADWGLANLFAFLE